MALVPGKLPIILVFRNKGDCKHMLHESNNISSKLMLLFFLPVGTTHFISRTPQFSAQKFKVASRDLSPTLPAPFKMRRIWPTELAFEAALYSVPERGFPVLKQWRVSAAALVMGLSGSTCSAEKNSSGRRWDKRGHWCSSGSTAHTSAPQ